MSFYQQLQTYLLRIPADQVRDFINAIHAAKFDDVDIDEPRRNSTGGRMIRVCGWHFLVDGETGTITEIPEYPARGNGDIDFAVMQLVAQFADDGYIEMAGESCSLWRWVFKDHECTEVLAVITWPGDTETSPEAKITRGLELLREGMDNVSTETCPYCHSDDIQVDSYDGTHMMTVTCSCNKCGCVWNETYEFCGQDIVEPGVKTIEYIEYFCDGCGRGFALPKDREPESCLHGDLNNGGETTICPECHELCATCHKGEFPCEERE